MAAQALILAFSGLFFLLAGATSAFGALGQAFALNENQILYLFSTSAQVLAGVYGLTLTAFGFFRNELTREEFEDETLVDAVESLKRRYFALLVFITALVLVTFCLSNLAMTSERSSSPVVNTVIINCGQSAFATSLLAIAYFIFELISPRRIEVASRALQDKVDPAHGSEAKGNLEEFLRNYNQIEMLLSETSPAYRVTSYEPFSSKPLRRTSNVRLAEILRRSGRISDPLFSRLRNLITLRNSIIHGADPVVSPAMVDESRSVLGELRNAPRDEL